MKYYGRICKKKYLTYDCGSDRNIRPLGTRPWAGPSARIFRYEPQHMTYIISLTL
jgi:hypothetical protein